MALAQTVTVVPAKRAKRVHACGTRRTTAERSPLPGRHAAANLPRRRRPMRRFRKPASAAAAPATPSACQMRPGQDRGASSRCRCWSGRANAAPPMPCMLDTVDPARPEQSRGDAGGDVALPDGGRDRALGARRRGAVGDEARLAAARPRQLRFLRMPRPQQCARARKLSEHGRADASTCATSSSPTAAS